MADQREDITAGPITEDAKTFYALTGLHLDLLWYRHLGQPSEGQVSEWISLVLGKRKWSPWPYCWVLTGTGAQVQLQIAQDYLATDEVDTTSSDPTPSL